MTNYYSSCKARMKRSAKTRGESNDTVRNCNSTCSIADDHGGGRCSLSSSPASSSSSSPSLRPLPFFHPYRHSTRADSFFFSSSSSSSSSIAMCLFLFFICYSMTSIELASCFTRSASSQVVINPSGGVAGGGGLLGGGAGAFKTRQQRVPIKDLQKSLKMLSDNASKNLSTLFNNATQRLYYQLKYQCSLTPVNARSEECRKPVDPARPDRPPLSGNLVKTNGAQLVQNLSAELEEKMKQKMDAVKRSVKAAEQAYVDYKQDDTIKGITYFNAKRINRPNMIDKYFPDDNPYRNFLLHYDTHFKADVNLSHSVVHVPTNVFDGSTEINNGARWTMRLNDIFVENREQDKSIYWQYFGSALGFYRVFPGSKWATSSDKIEMFDCRTKGWYIQASCSPKDLVILLDSSGSMLGLRFRIAMNTVDQILKTLGEDDFFNIIKFDSSVDYVDQCFNGTLLQATAENKERLRRKIRDIDPKEMADFEKALTEAFMLFNKTSEEKVGSMCNRAIMLITDGASDTYEHIFEKYNSPNRTASGMSQVRVFSFLIGQDASYNREINWMACRNKGYYVEIKTIAAVQDNMKQYVTTLARPLALADYNDVTWTGVYIDEAEYEYASAKSSGQRRSIEPKKKKLVKSSMPDMRLMASVAAPVFDKKSDSSKQGLLGVIGTDLPIHFFRTFVAPPKLGVDAYAFAVNHNGFVLFHPDYIPPFEAPDFTNVDVSKLEMKFLPWEWYKKMRTAVNGPLTLFYPNGTSYEVEVLKNDTAAAMSRLIALLNKVNSTVPDYNLELRNAMSKADTGHFWMTSLKTIDDHARPKVIGMHYYYTQIPFTPFTLGVAIPGGRTNMYDYGFVHMNARIDVKNADMTVLEAQEGLQTKIPSQWNYCYLSAEELEVRTEDYEEQLKEMYHEFEENYNLTISDEMPDVLESLEPSVPPDRYCAELRDLINNTVIFTNDTMTLYNKTAIAIYNSTFPAVEKFTYLTTTNETAEYFSFNETKCIERVKAFHIDQLREDMQAWMFEKKFQQTLKEYIEKGKDGSVDFREKCDQETIENLMFDAEVTNDTTVKLFDGLLHYNVKHGISMIFIATRSGLTRYVTPDHSESDFVNTHPETIRETYYERAVEAGPDVIIVSLDTTPQTPKRLILAQAMFVQHATTDGNVGRAAVAVAGIEMPARDLSDLIFSQPCDDTGGRCMLQCSNTTLCYLLDDNGYIVYSEYEMLIGRSLAEVDPNLFIQLTNYDEIVEDGEKAKKDMPAWESGSTFWAGLYEMILFDDYQAICPIYEERAGAGHLINPFTMIFRFVIYLVANMVWLFSHMLISLVTSVFLSIRDILVSAADIPAECLAFLKEGRETDEFWNCTVNQTQSGKYRMDSTRKPKILGRRVCTKRYNIYRLNTRATRLNGELTEKCRDCSTCAIATADGVCFNCNRNGSKFSNLTSEHLPNCTRSWRAQILPKTNLVMLVVDNWCVCERNPDIVRILENKTLEFEDDDEQCQMLKMPRERRLPNKCASDNAHENVTMCGFARRLSPSFGLSYWTVSFATILVQLIIAPSSLLLLSSARRIQKLLSSS